MKLDAVLTTILVGCAAITTGLVVYRHFLTASARSVLSQQPQDPVFIRDWSSRLGQTVRLGSSAAPIQLVEFADFECPYCAGFHQTLKAVQQRYGTQVAISYVHYPLPMHRFAEPAARAAECARAQGRFEPMHDLLFDRQGQLGLKSWNEFAQEAGVPDLLAFEACVERIDPVPNIEAGKQLASELNIRGTPTLLINGWKLARPPTLEELDRMIRKIQSGKSPIT